MQIISPLQTGVLQKPFSFAGSNFLCVSLLWCFRLTDGEPVLQAEMWEALAPLLEAGRPFDYGMPKERPEFLCLGDFHPPEGTPVKQGMVSVTVAGRNKRLAISGPRSWGRDGLPSRPQPVTSVPIRYNHAYGGVDFPDNPIGIGRALDAEGRQPLPLIEYPDAPVTSPSSAPPPGSLEPIDFSWRPRQRLAGTYDEEYQRTRMPGLPDDVDWRVFNDAPEDQWLNEFPHGDETFELINLHPDQPRMEGRLPRVRGRAFVDIRTHARRDDKTLEFREVPLKLDTIWLIPSSGLGVVIHRGSTRVHEIDGTDVAHILGAHEGLDDPMRPESHYRNEMSCRTDPDASFRYLLDTRPLLPVGCPCALQTMIASQPSAENDATVTNLEHYAQQKGDQGRQEAHEHLKAAEERLEPQQGEDLEGFAETGRPELAAAKENVEALGEASSDDRLASDDEKEIQAIVDRALPRDDNGNLDLAAADLDALDELEVVAGRHAERHAAEARQQLTDQITELRKQADAFPDGAVPAELESNLDRLERIAAGQMDAPPLSRPHIDPTTLDEAERQIKAAQAEADRLRELGLDEVDIQARIPDTSELKQQVEEANTLLQEQYRDSAHYMGEVSSPHPGEEAERRSQLLSPGGSALRADRDYAFVDLSGQSIQGLDLSGALLEDADLTNATFVDVNLTGAVLSRARLHNCRFERVNLQHANLGATDMHQAAFEDCDLREAHLGRARVRSSAFRRCNLTERDDMFLDTEFVDVAFHDTNLTDALFFERDLCECSFENSNLSDATFMQCTLTGASFRGVNLFKTVFVSTPIARGCFDRAHLHDTSFIDAPVLNDSTFTGADAFRANFRDADTAGADFRDAKILECDFSGADLTGAHLDRCQAIGAQFVRAVLDQATLNRANLREASLMQARLIQAQLRSANLYSVSFLQCTLGDTDFTGANLDNTILRDWRPRNG